jgi:D-beta-D-heptose 7-phosphate kinase/D-beta-D-heptose 1-phosphate adenosyltransferase
MRERFRMPNDLSAIVRRARGHRVLLVGDLILDQYIYGDAERISPEAPVPVLRVVERSDAVGGSGNVAACLQALGVQTVVCGVVGNDPMGRRLKELLSQLGADATGVHVAGDRPTITKTRLVGLAQHRHRQQLMRVDEELVRPLEGADRDSLRGLAIDAIARVDAICIEDYEKGLITAELVAELVAEAKQAGKPVLVDPGRITDYTRYRGATLLTPNRSELALAIGRTCTDLEEIATEADRLRRAIAARAMIVTLDREGAVLVEEDRNWQHLPTRPRSVYDNTGAGDAVLAMLAAAMVAGADLPDAARLANVAGGLEVEKFGCVPIPTEEVLAELRLEDRQRNGKLRSQAELVNELKLRRDRGESVVFTNGCFDLLHAGHVDFLNRCRAEGSLLVVGINSDASVRAQFKGDQRPIVGEQDRARVLGALACVDYVVIFDEPDPARIVELVRPDVLVKGADWSNRGVVGREFVEKNGGRVKLLPLVEGHSTTALINRILDSAARNRAAGAATP